MNDYDDIPVIQRLTAAAPAPAAAPVAGRSPLLLAAGLAAALVAGLGGYLLLARSAQPDKTAPSAAQASTTNSNTLLGHHRFKQAAIADLTLIDGHRNIYLHRSAAGPYRQMVRAAAASGVHLVALSGFRGERHQQELYLRQLGRAGTADAATLINAPPGYSEHHTGYALDLGDGDQAGANVQPRFERTAAFRWLTANARKFGFELSFPRHNPGGVSYEPWHWRFVGDRKSLETFYKN
ncbi:D-alanyl-D-alanine carboxypeptidase [Gloeobacter kilaueensis JS1]|uniref:D-alanyl-D-alanine carboxypeptidase n=2 Tax=Gloeobacter TaxID=33071 RepID=U5QP44_GLOK1|nr:D-alanyl-D-alanine carboxypeptidase [Gloeobacter kilaueensis JS1]